MNWYSKEADKTYIALGGLIIGLIVVVGLFCPTQRRRSKRLAFGRTHHGNHRHADANSHVCSRA